MFNKIKDKLENIFKIGKYTNVSGSDGQLQEVQIQTLRNIEDALKVGQFGFNSKAPINSRSIVARIGNENIVIANEHQASILDISSGNTIIYNQSGDFIKLESGIITISAPTIISNCEEYTINASTKFTVNSPDSNFDGGTVKNDGVSFDKTHFHTQNPDSAGNTQANVNPPS